MPSHVFSIPDNPRSRVHLVSDRATVAALDSGHRLHKRATAHDNILPGRIRTVPNGILQHGDYAYWQ